MLPVDVAEEADPDGDDTEGDADGEAEFAAVFETVPVMVTLWFTCCERLMLGSAVSPYSSSSASGPLAAAEPARAAGDPLPLDFDASVTFVSLNAPPLLSTQPVTVTASFPVVVRVVDDGAG